MPGYAKFADEIGEAVVSATQPLQDLSVDVVTSVAEWVGDLLPAMPVQTPTTPSEVVDANFGLAQSLIANQKSYVGRLLEAIGPITDKFMEAPKSKKVSAG